MQNSSYRKVKDIFNGYLKENRWVKPGSNTKSIATLAKPLIIDIELSQNTVKPRLIFKDIVGDKFDCPVNDLTLWNQCRWLVIKKGINPTDVKKELIDLFKKAPHLYLRVGLARPFESTPGQGERCYFQVTAIHTIPDYLKGKSFDDFSIA